MRMKRVRGCSHLYLRGHSYIYRRAVPADVRAAFGGRREVQKSLGTTSLAEARHLMNDQQRLFEQTLSDARGVISPIEKIHRQVALPSVQDMEIAVRQWLTCRIEREREAIAVKSADEEDTYLADLPVQQLQWDSAAKRGPITPHLSSQWIAEGLAEEHGWDLKPETSAHRSLLRLISRAQFEAAERVRQELEGEAVRAVDQRFTPEQYQLDATRARTGSKTPVSLKGLLVGFLNERQPAPATVKSYTRQFNAFCHFMRHDDASAISPHDVVRWKEELQIRKSPKGDPLSPKTIRDTYLAVLKVVFQWGVENHRLAANPADKIKVRGKRAFNPREEKGLTDCEAMTILKATFDLPPSRLSPERASAMRWVPWICAFTGARVNEITQLRAEDVFQAKGIWSIRITPEAGSVKDHEARVVALHRQIIAQGFLKFVDGKSGPLFYDPRRSRGGKAANPQSKKTGEFLARWVRSLGVDDPNVQPNHGWRHRFTSLGRLHGIPSEIRKAITGHGPEDVSETYGDTPIEVKAREIAKLPDYQIHR